MLDLRFVPHNSHLNGRDAFIAQDPHLSRLLQQPLVYRSPLIHALPRANPGIYALYGGRQVGKTTLLKQWMQALLDSGIDPRRIVFATGEVIDDHHALITQVDQILRDMPEGRPRFLILDEITYISEWARGVKYLADAGFLSDVVLVVTGSDGVIVQETLKRLPGRRGTSSQVEFHLRPLSFPETVRLKKIVETPDALFDAFDEYLYHGGFLTAINDMATHHRIQDATLAIYGDWIRGDVLKRNKHEHYLKEIIAAVQARLGSQITWNGLCRQTSVQHPQTVSEYIALLESMDVLLVQSALREDRLSKAPKKAKKVHFSDPFIHHAVKAWLHPAKDLWRDQVLQSVAESQMASQLVESAVTSHFARCFPTYYIKTRGGEVDIAYVEGRNFHPIEVKWRRQMRPKDIQQISKYPDGVIFTRTREEGELMGVRTEPLPQALMARFG